MIRNLIVALLLVFAVPACATIASITGQEEVSTYDERALLTAEIAFDTALDAVLAAQLNLTADQSAQIIPKLEAAKQALDKARSLYDANQIAEGQTQTGSAISAVAALLQALIDEGVISK